MTRPETRQPDPAGVGDPTDLDDVIGRVEDAAALLNAYDAVAPNAKDHA